MSTPRVPYFTHTYIVTSRRGAIEDAGYVLRDGMRVSLLGIDATTSDGQERIGRAWADSVIRIPPESGTTLTVTATATRVLRAQGIQVATPRRYTLPPVTLPNGSVETQAFHPQGFTSRAATLVYETFLQARALDETATGEASHAA